MGAWQSNSALDESGGYYRTIWPRLSNLGVLAVKKELDYNGCNVALNTSNDVFGMGAYRSAKKFQLLVGITTDGIVGPQTARYLFRKRAVVLEARWSIPDELLQRLKSLESANDPSAYGFSDPDDHGLVQINLRIHSSITLAQALDPFYALSYAANALASTYNKYADWDVAVASWNVGVGGAGLWAAAGKPATGGSEGFVDLYDRATKYVALVRSQPL